MGKKRQTKASTSAILPQGPMWEECFKRAELLVEISEMIEQIWDYQKQGCIYTISETYEGIFKSKQLSDIFRKDAKCNKEWRRKLRNEIDNYNFSVTDLEKVLEMLNQAVKKLETMAPNNPVLIKPETFKRDKFRGAMALSNPVSIKSETSEQDKFREILAYRDIKYLVHFTQVNNLKSILVHGLVSRNKLDEVNVNYLANDDKRVDLMRDCSSLSVEYANLDVLRSFRKKDSISNWAILVFDVNVLHENKAYFVPYNAATGNENARQGIKEKCQIKDLEELFKDEILVPYSSRSEESKLRKPDLKTYYPTYDQAEVLVEGTIDLRYIKYVIFENEESMKKYRSLLNDCNIKYVVDRHAFHLDRTIYDLRAVLEGSNG